MCDIITYNKVINLYSVYFYLSHWEDNTLEYLREKYYRLFKSLPDKVKIINNKIIGFNDNYSYEFFKDIDFYKNKWLYNNINDDDLKMLFTVNIICKGKLTIKSILDRYNSLYTSYLFINEESQKHGLHVIYQEFINIYEEKNKEELLNIDRKSKIFKLNEQINQGSINI